MKKLLTGVLSLCLVAASTTGFAQLKTPQPSPKAMVMQEVGITEITVEYSAPRAKGRTIFGGLVPYDEMWRTGANKATKITFSTDVLIEGQELKAGSYSLFTIPGRDNWTIIFNKNTELWGTGDHKEAEDALRVTAKPVTVREHVECMAFSITDFTYNEAKLNLIWEKTRVSIDIEVPTDELVMSSIEETLYPGARAFQSASRYTINVKDHYEEGLKWAKKAIEIAPESWYAHWLASSIYSEMGNNSKALEHAEKALELGNQNPERFFYKDRVEEMIREFSQK